MKSFLFGILLVGGAAFLAPSATAATVMTTTDASVFSAGMIRPYDIRFSQSPYGPVAGLFTGAQFSTLRNATFRPSGLNAVLAGTGVVVGAEATDLGFPAPAGRGDNIIEVINGGLVGDYRPQQLTSHVTVGFLTIDPLGRVTMRSSARLGVRVVTTGTMRVSLYRNDRTLIASVSTSGSGFFGFTSNEVFSFVVFAFSNPQGTSVTGVHFDGNGLGSSSTTGSVPITPGVVAGASVTAPALLFGAQTGDTPNVTVLKPDGSVLSRFLAFDEFFRGGVSAGMGDFDGDGENEIAAASGRGRAPEVRIFELDGTYRQRFFAYKKSFRGGVNISVGDLDGDGKAEIVTAPKRGGGPQVRIFASSGTRFVPTAEHFFAYHPKFRGGIMLALGDIDGNGQLEILTAPERGGGPQIRAFSSKMGIYRPMTNGVMAYDAGFRGGVSIAAGDLDGDGKAEIVTVPRSGGNARVRVFQHSPTGLRALQTDFVAFTPGSVAGATIAVLDANEDGINDIAVAGLSRTAVEVRAFSGNGNAGKTFSLPSGRGAFIAAGFQN